MSQDKAAPKKLSPYMVHMKKTLAEIKAKTPGIVHQEAFKQAAALWAKSPQNPNAKAAKSVAKASVKKTTTGGKAVVKKTVKKKTVAKKAVRKPVTKKKTVTKKK